MREWDLMNVSRCPAMEEDCGPLPSLGGGPRSSASDSTNREHHAEPYPPAKDIRVTVLDTMY